MEEIAKEVDDPDFVQPHPLVFSWCFASGIDTDYHIITKAILRGESIQPRSQQTGEKKDDYIFFLNSMLEDYMKERNLLWQSWPEEWRTNVPLATELLHSYAVALDPLRERMRALVRTRGSDTRFTPATVKSVMQPKLFFLLMEAWKDDAVMGGTSIDIAFTEASQIDFLLRPTTDDLRCDGTFHPLFHHPLYSRWYHQTFDADNATDPHPTTRAPVPRPLRWRVTGAVLVRFFLRTNSLHIHCTWEGSHKRASGLGGGFNTGWTIGGLHDY